VQNANLINAGRIEEKLSHKININSGYVDGQWVASEIVLLDNSTSTGDLDLSTYLPNDNSDYEVLFSCLAQAKTSGGVHNYITSDLVPYQMELGYLSTGTTTTSSTIFHIPIGESRKITITGGSTKTLKANAYRRIGKNQ
jgi:hypothetical protein